MFRPSRHDPLAAYSGIGIDRAAANPAFATLENIEPNHVLFPGLITRHVIAELLKVFLVGLTIFTFLILFAGLAQEAIRQGLGPFSILRIVPYAVLNALVFAIPATILFSVSSVFGRMSASNEVVALKSLGISAMSVVRPALVFALLLSLVLVWLIDMAFSWGYWGVQRVVMESVEDIAYGVLRKQRNYQSKSMSINVARVDGRKLIRPTITIRSDDGQPVTIIAQEAELRAEREESELRLILTNGVVESENGVKLTFTDTIEHAIPLPGSAKDSDRQVQPSHMPLAEIPAAREQQLKRLESIRQEQSATAASQMLTGDLAGLTSSRWKQQQQKTVNAQERLHRLDTEPYRRWASGFSCLCFVVVGAPLAMRLRNSDLMTTFGICFLPILIVYYPLFALGLDRAKDGSLPPYCVWMGNIACLFIGLMLLRKVVRY
jgi:lipopolysaccharide export system permease protein